MVRLLNMPSCSYKFVEPLPVLVLTIQLIKEVSYRAFILLIWQGLEDTNLY